MTIIGYAYEADTHCLGCTKARFGEDALEVRDEYQPGYQKNDYGEPLYEFLADKGEPIFPIYDHGERVVDIDGTEWPAICSDCRGSL